jgi:phospholipase A1/A2
MQPIRLLPALIASLLFVPVAGGQDLAACHAEADKLKRLECYDSLSGRKEPGADPPRVDRPHGLLAERWGYDRPAAQSRFQVQQHDTNYVTMRYSDRVNAEPTSPTHPDATVADLDPTEFKFQLSAKARVLDLARSAGQSEHDFGLWLAYTQQSHWQILNGPQSRPFRETDYQPEVILAFRPELFTDQTALGGGVDWRVFNVGFLHHSNGQSDPLSRSWNRLYAQFGFEKSDPAGGDWALLLRPWYRFKEAAAKDDNPDITDFMGHGDIRLLYRKGAYSISLMGRGNPRTGKGAGQLEFVFPLWFNDAAATYPFKGYLQVFSGYGESLIDYNWRQTTVGIGFMLNDQARRTSR